MDIAADGTSLMERFLDVLDDEKDTAQVNVGMAPMEVKFKTKVTFRCNDAKLGYLYDQYLTAKSALQNYLENEDIKLSVE